MPISTLELRVLGQPHIFLDGKPLALRRNKGQALLFYLAVTAVTHSRPALAGLLWELPERRARSNLSVELGDLKKCLGGYLSIQGRQTIAFNQESDYVLDTARFRYCLNAEQPSLSDLKTAVDLYQGHFLLGFDVKNAPLFEQWVLTQRAQLEPMAFRAMYTLAAHYSQQKQYKAAINYIDRLLLLEPLIEEAHRQKIILLALSGRHDAAVAQYEACCAVFAKDEDEPSPETTALYQQLLRGKITDAMRPELDRFVPVFELDKELPPFQAPDRPPHVIGRDQLIASLREQLLTPTTAANIHALVGMGGIGKSTLALHLAHELRDIFEDGVLWADASISDPMDVLESWGNCYGYDFSGLTNVENRTAAWQNLLAEKKVLIILDGVDSVTRIRPLLGNSPQGAFLLTTRDHDIVRALNTKVTVLTELAPASSLQLLVQILGKDRVAVETEAAVEICSLLQHLPLAIEIIAQRLKSRPRRSLTAVVKRLHTIDNRLAELEMSDRAVRTSFQASWETLDNSLRRLFCLLAPFAGRSFTAVALSHIADLDPYLTEDRLFTLTALSLVKENRQNRYQQHALLADFASEKLGGDSQAYISMARYYHLFATNYHQNYAVLRPEWANMMAALKTAYQYEQWQLSIEYAETLHEAWFARGHYDEARQGYELAYQSAQILHDKETMAQSLYQWSRALVEQSLYDEARQLLLKNLEQYKALAANDINNAGLAAVYYELARIAMELSQHDKAEQLLIQSRAIREAINDTAGIAETVEGQARLSYQQGEYQKAHAFGLKALAYYEESDHKTGIIESLRILTNTIIELYKQGAGELDCARNYGERALHLAEALQDRGEQAVTFYALSRVYMWQGEFQQAEEIGKQGLELLESIGDQRSQAIVLRHLGEIQYNQDACESALAPTYRGLAIFQKLGARLEVAVALSNLGAYYDCLNQSEKARENWVEALTIAQSIGYMALITRLEQQLQRVDG